LLENTQIKIPETNEEIKKCHEIREYVLKESFADDGLVLNHYDPTHPAHNHPNISLIYLHDGVVIGSVRMDKKFEYLNFKENEFRLALFAITEELQGKGFGAHFFAGIKSWCQQNAIDTVYTNARVKAHPFWKKMGFIDKVWDDKAVEENEIQMVLKI